MKTYIKYGAILIGVYLAVNYATGSGQLLNSGQTGAVNVVKAFQGR